VAAGSLSLVQFNDSNVFIKTKMLFVIIWLPNDIVGRLGGSETTHKLKLSLELNTVNSLYPNLYHL
jgi:hypothetical protein